MEDTRIYRSKVEKLHLQLPDRIQDNSINYQVVQDTLAAKDETAREFFSVPITPDGLYEIRGDVIWYKGEFLIYISIADTSYDFDSGEEPMSSLGFTIVGNNLSLHHRLVRSQEYGISGRDLLNQSFYIINYLRNADVLPSSIDSINFISGNVGVIKWARKREIGFSFVNPDEQEIFESAVSIADGPVNAGYVKIAVTSDDDFSEGGEYILERDDYYEYYAVDEELSRVDLRAASVKFELSKKLDPIQKSTIPE